MDQRAALPVSLPVPHSTTSYWQTPPSAAIADYLSADIVPEEVDVCIIGSGITGAGVAWNWLKDNNIRPAARGQGSVSDGNEGGKGEERRKEKIIMLEARQTCSGATGRNGTSPFQPFTSFPSTPLAKLTHIQAVTQKQPPTAHSRTTSPSSASQKL